MRCKNICHRRIGRTWCLRCTPPGTWVEDLEDTFGMTASNRNWIICQGIKARFTTSYLQSAVCRGTKNLIDHGYYCGLTRWCGNGNCWYLCWVNFYWLRFRSRGWGYLSRYWYYLWSYYFAFQICIKLLGYQHLMIYDYLSTALWCTDSDRLNRGRWTVPNSVCVIHRT